MGVVGFVKPIFSKLINVVSLCSNPIINLYIYYALCDGERVRCIVPLRVIGVLCTAEGYR